MILVYHLVIISDRELSDGKQTRVTAGQNTSLSYFIHLYFDNLPIQDSSDRAVVLAPELVLLVSC